MNSPEMRRRCSIAVFVCILAAATEGCVRQRPVAVRLPSAKASKSSSTGPDLSEYIRTAIKLSQENTATAQDSAARLSLEDPAVAELAQRVAAGANDMVARRRLAAAYLAKKLYINAFQLYQEIQTKDPNDATAVVALAEICDAWGDYSLAREHAERAIALDPKSPAALALAGRVYLHSGRLDSALTSFAAALALEPDSTSILNNAGYACLLQGNWENARLHFERALALDPSIPEVQNNLGVALGNLGDQDGALRHFMAANTPAAAHNNVGVVYLAQKRWAEAHQQFRQALAIDPSYAKAQTNLHEAAAQLRPPTVYTVSFGGSAQAGAAALPSSLLWAEYHPIFRARITEYARGLWNATRENAALDATGRDWPAPADYAQIRVGLPETPAASGPGSIPARAETEVQATPAARAAQERTPPARQRAAVDATASPRFSRESAGEDAAALAAAGQEFLKRGQWEKARIVLEQAVAVLEGSRPEIRRSQGAALTSPGDRDGALRQLTAAERTGAVDHNRLGLVHLDQKRFKEAQEEFRKAVAANPGDSGARANLREAESYLPPPRVYTIQIAAQRTPEQAAAAAEKPAGAGVAPEIVRANLDEKGLLYRARLYGYSSWKTAVEMARKLLTGDYWIARDANGRSGS